MNIRQYYEQTAAVSLNAGLAALIPPIFILFYSIVITEMYQLLLLVIPFLIYSFACYQVFLLHKKRARSIKIDLNTDELSSVDLLQESTFLLHFMPAPTLRLLFFTPTGIKAGEIRDRSLAAIRWFLPFFLDRYFRRSFILYDQKDKPFVHFHLYNDRIEIMTKEGGHLTTIYKLKKGKCKEFLLDRQSIIIQKRGIPADYFFLTSDNTEFAKIQSGMMPLEWEKRFPNPNTPILTLSPSEREIERCQLWALLITLYIYANH